jgi:hypothetical protein
MAYADGPGLSSLQIGPGGLIIILRLSPMTPGLSLAGPARCHPCVELNNQHDPILLLAPKV